MKIKGIRILVAWVAFWFAGFASAQDEVPKEQEETVAEQQEAAAQATATAVAEEEAVVSEWRTQLMEKHGWLLNPPISELKLHLAPLTKEELEERAAEALAAVQEVARKLSEDLIEHMNLMEDEDADQGEKLAIDKGLSKRIELRQDLITRANIVFTELDDKGGDTTAARGYISVIEKLEPETRKTDETISLSEEEQEKQRVAARVAAAVADVRAMPPVHERPEPWTVDITELELELQPLRKDQIDERVQKWLDILQRELRQRIRMDIAIMQTEDEAERQALADQSTAQQEIVKSIVERVRAALMILQKRGGDVSEYNDYIANATGQRLNLTNPAVLYAQAKAWIRSPSGGIKVGLNILQFLVILLVFWIASRIVARLLVSALKRMPKSSGLLVKFLGDITRWGIMIVGIAVAINSLGVTVGPLIAAIGAAGLVIGLALQGTLSNFASGILILVTRPFDVGDVINAGGVFGKVDAMNLVSTRVLTFDNQVMLVPNNQIWDGVITNLTALDTRRVDLTFGIAYNADINKAKKALEEILEAHPMVLDSPAPMIKVSELADSSVNLIVRPWTKTSDYWDVYWDLMHQVKERFDAEGIGIPFPQRDVHLYTNAVPELSGKA